MTHGCTQTPEAGAHNQPARILLNGALAQIVLHGSAEEKTLVEEFALHLLEFSTSGHLKEEALGPKMANQILCHLWQSICLLIGHAGNVKEQRPVSHPTDSAIQENIWRSVRETTRQSGVRHLIQSAALAALIRWPRMVDMLLQGLLDYNQVSLSLFVSTVIGCITFFPFRDTSKLLVR